MVRYLNGVVSDVGEELVMQLLTVEHCTSPKDQKEYVSVTMSECRIAVFNEEGRYGVSLWHTAN